MVKDIDQECMATEGMQYEMTIRLIEAMSFFIEGFKGSGCI